MAAAAPSRRARCAWPSARKRPTFAGVRASPSAQIATAASRSCCFRRRSGRRESRVDVAGRGGECRRERAPRGSGITGIPGEHARQIVRGRELRLHLEHLGIGAARRVAIAALMRPHARLPRRGEARRGDGAFRSRSGKRGTRRRQRGDEVFGAGDRPVHERRHVHPRCDRHRPDLARRMLRQERPCTRGRARSCRSARPDRGWQAPWRTQCRGSAAARRRVAAALPEQCHDVARLGSDGREHEIERGRRQREQPGNRATCGIARVNRKEHDDPQRLPAVRLGHGSGTGAANDVVQSSAYARASAGASGCARARRRQRDGAQRLVLGCRVAARRGLREFGRARRRAINRAVSSAWLAVHARDVELVRREVLHRVALESRACIRSRRPSSGPPATAGSRARAAPARIAAP